MINQSAWMIPGTKKTRHKRIFMIKSLPTPFFKNTATGGKKIANMIKTILFI
jgi:hypothetical protein